MSSRRVALVVALAGAACSVVDGAPRERTPPTLPGPFRPARLAEIAEVDGRGAAALDAACEGCHVAIAAEHRASLHRAATTDASYASALAAEPMPFCRGCHAPEADPAATPDPVLDAVGVGCVSCHVTRDGILAAPRAEEAPRAARAPHPVVRDARFGAEGACAGCHEFDFPRDAPKERMQRTVTEHAASRFSSVACATCHMPRVTDAGAGHASHAFAASRSAAMVNRAVDVRVSRVRPTSASVTLSPARVGHAFPTGDLFRRVTVVVEAIGDDFSVVAREERHLARHFALTPRGHGVVRTEIADDRPGSAGPRALEIDLGEAAAGLPLHVSVRYERVSHPISRDGEEAVVDGAVLLADVMLEGPID